MFSRKASGDIIDISSSRKPLFSGGGGGGFLVERRSRVVETSGHFGFSGGFSVK